MAMWCFRSTLTGVVNFFLKRSIDGALHDRSYTPSLLVINHNATAKWKSRFKAEIRRVLHAAKAPFSRWPLAARNVNEKLRLRQLRMEVKLPQFLANVLIRKRFWRARELLPTQETALYIGPSWAHHGHWIERQDGTLALTRMVMHQCQMPWVKGIRG